MTTAGNGARPSPEAPPHASAAEPLAPRSPRDRRRVVPASSGQASLWFVRQMMAYPSAYNTAVQFRMSGELDVSAAVAALHEIVRRHESLRTTFALVDGAVAQVIWGALAADVATVDLTTRDERESEATRIALAAAAQPFDLADGPLLRVRLVTLAPRDHLLIVVVDHIVADGMSLGILWQELEVLYPAFRAAQPSPLPAPNQFAKCIEGQARWLTTPAFAKQLKYWTEHLEGAIGAELPADRSRPAVRTYRGDIAVVPISGPTLTRLREACTNVDASLFAAMLSALYVVLARCSGRQDLAVMVPMAGRQRYGAENVVGYFANMVLLRTEVADELSFLELVGRVNKEIMAGVFRQDVPFAKVIEALRPDRSLRDEPLARVSLSFFQARGSSLSLPGLVAEFAEVPNGGAKFDLSLIITEREHDATISAEFNADIYDPETIRSFLERYRLVLDAACAAMDSAVGDLPLLVPDEEISLQSWNATEHAYPGDRCIHEIFEAQVDATPSAIALAFDGKTLSYSELEERANRLAHALRRRGVGPDVLVGICMHRSLELVVALYAVLKAGGAYVPVDPEYPRDRLAFVLQDASPRVVLTQPHLAHLLPEESREVLVLTEDLNNLASESTARPARAGVSLSNLAYVIYTSGSTGAPKGAMNEHRGIRNRLLWMQRRFALDASDRVLQKTPFSFDVSVWEFFWPLMFGARLVVAKPEGHRDPAYLAHTAKREGVTTLHFVPSMLRAFVEEPASAGCREVRRIFASGEALPAALCERFFEVLPATELHNLYGPTEAAVDVTHWPCHPGARLVPIGRPIDNVTVHVLDERRRPVPIGVAGELYIGGVQVGRGYLNRPELTAERFVRQAEGSRQGTEIARLYRTGDVARWLRSGDVEYLGRTDFQVKLRGFRIELGEIEATLLQHHSVREAVVVALQEPDDQRLVAYFTTRDGTTPTPAELRAHLHTKLPDYMVPARYMQLESMPLTTSNKIDRKALPSPARAVHGSASAEAAPRDEVDAKLCAIWEELLGVRSVGIHDNFFELGGHSLLALKLFDRITRTFGLALPIASLFQAPTVGALGDLLRRRGLAPSWSSLVPIQPSGGRRPFFCVHAIGGNVLNYRLLSQHLGKEVPFYGLQARGLGGNEPPHGTVEEMAAAYIAEMRREQPRGPYQLGGASSGGVVAYEMAQQLHAAGEEVSALVLFDTYMVGRPIPRLEQARAASPVHPRALLLDHHFGHLLLRTPREGLDYLLERVRARLGGTHGPVAAALHAANPAVRQVIEANLRAHASYVPRPYPGSAVMLLSREEPDRAYYDGRLAWADLLGGGLIVRFVPGNHETMLDEPTVGGVAAVLARCLA